mgnify:CR=1 FL=1
MKAAFLKYCSNYLKKQDPPVIVESEKIKVPGVSHKSKSIKKGKEGKAKQVDDLEEGEFIEIPEQYPLSLSIKVSEF